MNTQIVDTFRATLSQNPARTTAVAAAAVLGISVPLLVSNYRAYIALGPGGIPHNIVGWLISLTAKIFSRETRDTRIYDLDADKEHWLDPSAIPERRGSRPIPSWHPIPHRQLDRIPSAEIQQRLAGVFNARLAANPGLVEMATSPHERTSDGLIIHHALKSPHAVADKSAREIAHLHPHKDYSMHVTCAPQDCKILIERGWGERHPLSGTPAIPKEYFLIYAPRDQEELDVVERVFVASIGYMTGHRDAK
ncbi:hypothetical protein HWV62_20260 [Athelia sp. TMB]|nr:hypothetical protein HWV62_20260 [Athelia sp. TMB]